MIEELKGINASKEFNHKAQAKIFKKGRNRGITLVTKFTA